MLESQFDLPPWFDESYTQQNFSVHNCDNAATRVENFNAKSFSRLSPRDVETINDIAHTQMVRMGYEPSDPAEFADAERWVDMAAQ